MQLCEDICAMFSSNPLTSAKALCTACLVYLVTLIQKHNFFRGSFKSLLRPMMDNVDNCHEKRINSAVRVVFYVTK